VKPALKYFIIFLLVAALLPYFAICFYAFPFADDFCFGWTASENISFAQKFLNQYLYWNGRYSADVLVNLHPMVHGGVTNYQIIIAASLFLTPVVLYFLAKEFVSGANAVIVSLLVTLFYLNYQPNITEGVYWFIGISNYHFGILVFVLHLCFTLKAFENKSSLLFITSLGLLIISTGFNEVGALLFSCFYLVAYLLYTRKELLILFIGSLIASAFVFFSPGNFVRTSEFENRYDLFHSLFYSLLQTARFIATWMLSVPSFLLSFLVVAFADKIKFKFDYRITLAFLLFAVFTGSFLPYFATGVLGQHRTINFVFFFFILLWCLFLVSISKQFHLYQRLPLFSDQRIISLLIIISIFMMMHTANGYKIIADYKQNNFKKYETAFYEREKNILKNPDAPIEKLSAIPLTFQVVDVKSDTSWWVDKCMRKYYSGVAYY